MSKVKLGVIGLGAWGWNVGRCFYELPDCNLDACCDLSDSRRAAAEKNWPGVSDLSQRRRDVRTRRHPGCRHQFPGDYSLSRWSARPCLPTMTCSSRSRSP